LSNVQRTQRTYATDVRKLKRVRRGPKPSRRNDRVGPCDR